MQLILPEFSGAAAAAAAVEPAQVVQESEQSTLRYRGIEALFAKFEREQPAPPNLG
ncbi:MAG: hypothetical protein H6713_22420 [Myxococcales bacterium]|nr:hypothetical protein [Myxococcales bacterium]MCB9752719.1 hypothetical protein [Myxococcales bacterium]